MRRGLRLLSRSSDALGRARPSRLRRFRSWITASIRARVPSHDRFASSAIWASFFFASYRSFRGLFPPGPFSLATQDSSWRNSFSRTFLYVSSASIVSSCAFVRAACALSDIAVASVSRISAAMISCKVFMRVFSSVANPPNAGRDDDTSLVRSRRRAQCSGRKQKQPEHGRYLIHVVPVDSNVDESSCMCAANAHRRSDRGGRCVLANRCRRAVVMRQFDAASPVSQPRGSWRSRCTFESADDAGSIVL